MSTTTDIRENSAWLKGQGYAVDIIFKPAKRVQWYRADGVALPNLLPCDTYHLRNFRRKGWTLKPPTSNGVKPTVEAPLYVSDKPTKSKRHRRTRAEITRDQAKAQEG